MPTCIDNAIRTVLGFFYSNHCPILSTIPTLMQKEEGGKCKFCKDNLQVTPGK